MFDALKKAEKMKNLELLAVRNQFDSKIKALQHELKECQKNCKQLVYYSNACGFKVYHRYDVASLMWVNVNVYYTRQSSGH